MSTALINREYMMDEIGRNKTVVLQAFLAERMFGYVQVTDDTPAVIVVLRITISTVIFAGSDSLMGIAVASFADGDRAAGVSAGF